MVSDLYTCICVLFTSREKNITRTGCGEHREELDPARTVVDNAVPKADAMIATRDKDTGATNAELHEQSAQLNCIVFREILLLATVRRGDRLWDPRQAGHVAEPLEVNLRATGGAVEELSGRERDGLGVLDVGARLVAGFASDAPASDPDEGECRALHVEAVFFHEARQVFLPRVMSEEARNPEHVLVRRRGHVPQRIVQPAQVRRHDRNDGLRPLLHELSRR